jgi:hypothetical protein
VRLSLTTLLPSLEDTWPVLALHCTALHCTALHCTALHCTALHCIVDMPWRSSCYLMLGPCLLTTPLPAPIGWLVYLQGHHGVPGAAAHRHAAQAPHRGHMLPAVSTCTHARMHASGCMCIAARPGFLTTTSCCTLLPTSSWCVFHAVPRCAPLCPAVPRCAPLCLLQC